MENVTHTVWMSYFLDASRRLEGCPSRVSSEFLWRHHHIFISQNIEEDGGIGKEKIGSN